MLELGRGVAWCALPWQGLRGPELQLTGRAGWGRRWKPPGSGDPAVALGLPSVILTVLRLAGGLLLPAVWDPRPRPWRPEPNSRDLVWKILIIKKGGEKKKGGERKEILTKNLKRFKYSRVCDYKYNKPTN